VSIPTRVPGTTPDTRRIRVALPVLDPRFSATTRFQWWDGAGRKAIPGFFGSAGDVWRVERQRGGPNIRAVRPDGVTTPWQRDLLIRLDGRGFLTLNGKPYRGELAVLPLDTGLMIVNRLGLEDYLRGVVPREMGVRPVEDSAALQAQAVASRSYALSRVRDASGAFDVRATTSDQVYGGVEAEDDAANAAIDATRGLVVKYQGKPADAPFHSTCGGATAQANEVWRTPGLPYLQSVSDRIGSSNRYYCDIAPRFRWSRTFTARELNDVLDQYLRAYATVPSGSIGSVKGIGVRDRTPSGRVAALEIETQKGIYALQGNDIRYVMRQPGGEILYSTYFSVEPEYRGGLVSSVTLRGQGYGHGIGMCQWGAIGRARAGQSFRTILSTYYPGTTVGPIQ